MPYSFDKKSHVFDTELGGFKTEECGRFLPCSMHLTDLTRRWLVWWDELCTEPRLGGKAAAWVEEIAASICGGASG